MNALAHLPKHSRTIAGQVIQQPLQSPLIFTRFKRANLRLRNTKTALMPACCQFAC